MCDMCKNLNMTADEDAVGFSFGDVLHVEFEAGYL